MKHIIFCGQDGYPLKTKASINRYVAIADIFSDAGCKISFINRIGVHKKNQMLDSGEYDTYWPSGKYRSDFFLIRNIKKIFSPILEFFLILKLHRVNKISIINIYTEHFFIFILYWAFSKVIKAKTIVHVVEVRSSFFDRGIRKINDWFFENMTPFLADYSFAISTVTRNSILSVNPNAQVITIPPVFNFDQYINIETFHSDEPFFLYCASSAYEEVTFFVMESFLKANLSDAKLVLVVNGVSNSLREKIEAHKDKVNLLSNLEYSILLSLYGSARALIIPIRDSVQDTARFPQKICEYLYSRRPIITTANGDVNIYFKNNDNAFVCDSYDREELSDMIRFVMKNHALADNVGLNGYKVGEKYFNVKSYTTPVKEFLCL